jgi:hypothetical protein
MTTSIAVRRGRLIASAVLLGTLAGRGSDDTGGAETATADTAPPSASELPPGAEDLVGRYAHYDVVAYEDEAMRTLIISTGFADLELRDGELWNTMRFCHADAVSDQDIEVSISDAATQAIVPVDTPVEVTEGDGTLLVERPATPTGIGIALEDPANDVLPTDPDDPRIVDADGDGNPGITSTVRITEDLRGEIYLARREIFAYDVTAGSADRLEGTITDSSEQLVLGASDDIFLTPAQWVQVDDPARNPVIWQRVDDDWDCDRLAAEREDLFPPNPEADW